MFHLNDTSSPVLPFIAQDTIRKFLKNMCLDTIRKTFPDNWGTIVLSASRQLDVDAVDLLKGRAPSVIESYQILRAFHAGTFNLDCCESLKGVSKGTIRFFVHETVTQQLLEEASVEKGADDMEEESDWTLVTSP